MTLKDELGFEGVIRLVGIDVDQAREAVLEDFDMLTEMIEHLGGWSEIAEKYFDGPHGMLEEFVSDDPESLADMLGGLSEVANDIIGIEAILDSFGGLGFVVEKFDGEEALGWNLSSSMGVLRGCCCFLRSM